MVKERGGMVLSAALEPTEITEIDLSKLHQAARVNIDRYGAFLAPANGKAISTQHTSEDGTEKTYLCFINLTPQSAVAEYFVTALSCEMGAPPGPPPKAADQRTHNYANTQPE